MANVAFKKMDDHKSPILTLQISKRQETYVTYLIHGASLRDHALLSSITAHYRLCQIYTHYYNWT